MRKKFLTFICLLGMFMSCITSAAYAENNPIFDKYQKSGLRAAESEFNKTIKVAPKDDVSYASIIYLYIEENQHQKALNTCLTGIKTIPNSHILYNLLGMLYKDEGNIDAAIKAFNKSIEIEPSEPPYYNRARLYARIGQFDKAISDFTMAIKYSQTNPDAYKERAMAKLAKGATDKNLSDKDYRELGASAFNDLDIALKQYRETNNVDGYQEVLKIIENLNNALRKQ